MDNAIVLIGASGHCKVIIEIIEQTQGTIKAIYDAGLSASSLLGYPVQAGDPVEDNTIIAIGSNAKRKQIADSLPVRFATAVHPRANISTRCSIGAGSVVMAGATINSETVIGTHCIINTNASVDHDCIISDFAHISPNASLAGNVTVGEGAQVGIGSTVIQGVKIGKWAIIGAGSVVTRDVPDFAVVVGVPGAVIKYVTP
jgi:sugar O-acyltransferase (sialic acid O-acetyltransferase NeuD family)